MTYQTVARNYKRNLWSKYEVNIAVQANVITEEEYTKITGDIYSKYIPTDTTDDREFVELIADCVASCDTFPLEPENLGIQTLLL